MNDVLAMTDNHYDENIVCQLMVFGYSKQQIIDASNSVIDYKDINAVQAKLDIYIHDIVKR